MFLSGLKGNNTPLLKKCYHFSFGHNSLDNFKRIYLNPVFLHRVPVIRMFPLAFLFGNEFLEPNTLLFQNFKPSYRYFKHCSKITHPTRTLRVSENYTSVSAVQLFYVRIYVKKTERKKNYRTKNHRVK